MTSLRLNVRRLDDVSPARGCGLQPSCRFIAGAPDRFQFLGTQPLLDLRSGKRLPDLALQECSNCLLPEILHGQMAGTAGCATAAIGDPLSFCEVDELAQRADWNRRMNH